MITHLVAGSVGVVIGWGMASNKDSIAAIAAPIFKQLATSSFFQSAWMATIISVGSFLVPQRLKEFYWSMTHYLMGWLHQFRIISLQDQLKEFREGNQKLLKALDECTTDKEKQVAIFTQKLGETKTKLEKLNAQYIKLITEKGALSEQVSSLGIELMRFQGTIEIEQKYSLFMEQAARILQAYEDVKAKKPQASRGLIALIDEQIPDWREELALHLRFIKTVLTERNRPSQDLYLFCSLEVMITYQIEYFECIVKLTDFKRVSKALQPQDVNIKTDGEHPSVIQLLELLNTK